MELEQGAADRRVHIAAHEWGYTPATDFWIIPSGGLIAANGVLLSEHGWTTTSLGNSEGSGADFLTASDFGSPPRFSTNASGDLLQSPPIFGDWTHGQQAAAILGRDPVELVCEFWGSMVTHSANEQTSGWGLIEDGGSPATANDHLAFIHTDGSNFTLRSDADSDAGLVDSGGFQLFNITLSIGTTDAVSWSSDGVAQGTIDLKEDEFPVSFGMHAFTTNRPFLGPVHIWYR